MKIIKSLSMIDWIAHRQKLQSVSVAAGTPRIGVYWLHLKDGKIQIFHSEPITLELGEDYGAFIIAPQNHSSLWESLKRHNIVPKNSEYDFLPRGRIAYDKETKEYVAFHGNWLNSQCKSVIKSEFRLPSKTRFEPDIHYHKFKRWGLP